jgi:hypothetical protein
MSRTPIRVALLLALSLPLAAQANYSVVAPYLSPAQNPLLGLGPSWLENFEGAAVAGYTASAGAVQGPSGLTDSVDADDGTLDGFGVQGHSFYAGVGTITFTFNPATLGGLPTAVGIAFTDVGIVSGRPPCDGSTAVLWVFNASNMMIGQGSVPFNSLGSCRGEAADDIFFSWQGTQGVSSILVGFVGSVDWEVDHLTAAAPIPEPASWALMLLGGAALAGACRQRQRADRPRR